MIAGDMPIGLLEARQLGGRECDRQARQQIVEYPMPTLVAHHKSLARRHFGS
jgi:predicted RNase H-like nuclease